LLALPPLALALLVLTLLLTSLLTLLVASLLSVLSLLILALLVVLSLLLVTPLLSLLVLASSSLLADLMHSVTLTELPGALTPVPALLAGLSVLLTLGLSVAPALLSASAAPGLPLLVGSVGALSTLPVVGLP